MEEITESMDTNILGTRVIEYRSRHSDHPVRREKRIVGGLQSDVGNKPAKFIDSRAIVPDAILPSLKAGST